MLLPGEQLQSFGHLKQALSRNLLNVPISTAHWLAVATNQRFLFFATTAGGYFDQKPRAEARKEVIFAYDEIARIHGEQRNYGQLVPGGAPQTFSIVPHPRLGPFGGSAFSVDVFKVAEGIDGQHRFATEFLPWLGQQVGAGAFPMSAARQAEIQARFAAEDEKARVRAVEYAARSAASSAAFSRNAPVFLFVLLTIALVGAGGFLLALGIKDMSDTKDTVSRENEELASIEKILEVRKKNKMPPCKVFESGGQCGRCDHGAFFLEHWKKPLEEAKESGWGVYAADLHPDPAYPGQKWYCPTVDAYEAHVKDKKKTIAEIEARSTFYFTKIGAGGGGAIAFLVGGIFGTRWAVRRRKRLLAAPSPNP